MGEVEMDNRIYKAYVSLLREELTMATGCTEPIAIAYAGAKIREILGAVPDHCTVFCSGNIIKNVMAVTVPNSGGMRGIDTAALLGMIGGDASVELDVLHAVTEEHIQEMLRLKKAGICSCELVEGVANLYIRIEAEAGNDTALVEIREYHANITRLEKNGVRLKSGSEETEKAVLEDRTYLNVRDILQFADELNVEDVREILENQIRCNSAISEEGLRHPWGAQVGRTIEEIGEKGNLIDLARARAAAGSDARMNGCPMPVVINSGSGNQGIALTMPLVVYAEANAVEHDRLLRALALSNLIALHEKRFIGSLSAYCGAVSAATASACGVAYMLGAEYDVICGVLINSLNTTGGMVCDGAKSSCAAKIATAVGMALLAMEMSLRERVFREGEGLVEADVEQTIQSIGRMGRVGMKSTDVEILNIMLGK